MLSQTYYQLVAGCEQFLNTLVPRWKQDIASPIEALKRGVGSCAARSMLTNAYLSVEGIDSEFGIHPKHGLFKSNTNVRTIGHAVAFFSLDERELVMESTATGHAYVSTVVPELYDKYTRLSPAEGYSQYCERAQFSAGIDLTTLDVAVRRERMHLQELPILVN